MPQFYKILNNLGKVLFSVNIYRWQMYTIFLWNFFGNSADKLCHLISVAYSAQQVLLNKQQVAELHCYHFLRRGRYTWIFTTVNVHFTAPTPSPKVGNCYTVRSVRS